MINLRVQRELETCDYNEDRMNVTIAYKYRDQEEEGTLRAQEKGEAEQMKTEQASSLMVEVMNKKIYSGRVMSVGLLYHSTRFNE